MTDARNPKEIPRPENLRASWAPLPHTERGTSTIIGTHPKEQKLVYGVGKIVVVRDLTNPNGNFTYRGHTNRVTCAKFSPNGYWVASGDEAGKVRVWSYDHPEHLIKLETAVFNGEVKDIAWGPESKRIIAVGDGRESYAKAFMWDTGNSVGELTGHTKRVTSCDYKPNRPYRVITASEDSNTIFFQGPPFKFDHTNGTEHSNFVNCVRFSPDGSQIVSAGSDKTMHLYDGRTGEKTNSFPVAHTGSIYSVCWSPDGTKLLTAGGDKTCKLWDVASLSEITTFTFGTGQVHDMQVCVAWCQDSLLSVSLCGDINFLDQANPTQPSRIVQGHQVSVTALAARPDGGVLSASYDGVVCSWTNGVAKRLTGVDPRSTAGHRGKVSAVAFGGLEADQADQVLSVGWDDALRTGSVTGGAYGDELGLPGQPCGLGVGGNGLVVIAHTKGVTAVRNGAVVWSGPEATYTLTAVAVSPDETRVALGASDGVVRMYTVDASGSLAEDGQLEVHPSASPTSALAFSPDSSLIAVGDNGRNINVFESASKAAKVWNEWTFHSSRITGLAWAPSGVHLASGSLDEHVFVWDVNQTKKRVKLPFTHKEGVSGLAFVDESTVVTSGNDGCISTWEVAYP